MKRSAKKQKCKQRDKKNRKAQNPFENIFKQMDKMISNIHSHMKKVKNNSNCHSYSSSKMMTYHRDGKSRPKMMQTSSSTRKAPGNIKETRRTYRDNESGVEKISVGRYVGKRGHEHKKQRIRGGRVEEEQKFYEMNENDLPHFEKEWRQITAASKVPFQSRKAIRSNRKEKRSNKSRQSQKRRKPRKKC